MQVINLNYLEQLRCILSFMLQKSGRKRRLREDEIVQPTSRPVYKWRAERKR